MNLFFSACSASSALKPLRDLSLLSALWINADIAERAAGNVHSKSLALGILGNPCVQLLGVSSALSAIGTERIAQRLNAAIAEHAADGAFENSSARK
jgi:hypothetical protein